MATKRTKKSPQLANDASPVEPATHQKGPTGRYLYCPGSGLIHDQSVVEVQQGAKVLWYLCPVSSCNVKVFLRGAGWLEKGQTREQVKERNPDALRFVE